MTMTAKIFNNGGSQAVRLPAEFRFDSPEVFIRRQPVSGDVVLSAVPRGAWSDFVAVRNAMLASGDAQDFLVDREQPEHQDRDPFGAA